MSRVESHANFVVNLGVNFVEKAKAQDSMECDKVYDKVCDKVGLQISGCHLRPTW